MWSYLFHILCLWTSTPLGFRFFFFDFYKDLFKALHHAPVKIFRLYISLNEFEKNPQKHYINLCVHEKYVRKKKFSFYFLIPSINILYSAIIRHPFGADSREAYSSEMCEVILWKIFISNLLGYLYKLWNQLIYL